MSKLADVALACLDDSKASTNHWVELLACRFLQMGIPKLDAALLPKRVKERIPFELSMPTATVQRWSSPQEAAELCRNDMSVLCLPHTKNEPAIDAISSPSLYLQVTKAERHRVVRDALTKMNRATAEVGGGREMQLNALKERITWITDERVPLSMPLLCFIVTPQRFDTSYRSKQPYTHDKPSQAQVSHTLELSSVLIYIPLMLSDDSASQAHHFVASCLQSEVIHQCLVRLPVETIVRDCTYQVAITNFKRLVEELPDEDSAEAMEICSGNMSSRESSVQLEQLPIAMLGRHSG